MVQAFRGPRSVTEQELLATKSAGWWDNYVRFTPSKPARDTNWVYGVKGNAGTKFVLLPVGDRCLFCSARVEHAEPEFVGRLTWVEAAEVASTVPKEERGNLLPFSLQAVRSIWFDTGVALLAILGCLGGAAWLVVQVQMTRSAKRERAATRQG
jgi:hypothetical protein